MMAVNHALMVLSWYEHLPSEEMPPKWMWSLGEELQEHFERVKENRNSGTRDEDDGPMMKNEYARGRGRDAR